QSEDKKPITVTGCVQADTKNTVNTEAAPGFRLTNVPKMGARAAGSYVLDGSDVELKRHVGHTVEVIGTLLTRQAATTPTPKDADKIAPTVTAGGTNTQDNGAPRITVTAVRMISPDCKSE